MEIVRTPDTCFEELADFQFIPQYTEVTSDDGTPLRIHHIEEGPSDGKTIVLIHGNPTWSYLHRHMVKHLAASGFRAIALDLVGTGRSDKPADKDDYTLARHVDWVSQWFAKNELRNVALFCQDWGGHIGLIIVGEHPDWFSAVIAANTGLPEGKNQSEFLKNWRLMMGDAQSFPWDLIRGSFMQGLSESEFSAYLAPFPEERHQAGIVQFPRLIADNADNPGVPQCRAAWAALEKFDKPVLTLFGDSDPISAGMDKEIQQRIPGAAGQPHHVFVGGTHFIQEEFGGELVEHMVEFLS